MAEFGRVALQMQDTQVDAQCRAPGRLLAYQQGTARHLPEARYAVQSAADLDALRQRLAASSLATEEAVHPLLGGPAVPFRDPDGSRLSFGLACHAAAPGQGVLPARLQHFVVASTDTVRIAAFPSEVVGMEVPDRMLDDAGRLRAAFLRADEEHHSCETADGNSIWDWADHFAAQRIQIQWGPGGGTAPATTCSSSSTIPRATGRVVCRPGDDRTGLAGRQWPQEERSLNLWGKAYLHS